MATNYDIPPTIFFALLVDDSRRKQAQEGVKALIWQYYEDYTDATELDADFLGALRKVTSTIGSSDAYLSDTLDEVIRETENEINEFYALGTSAIAARQDHQPVGTPGLDIDDDEED